MGKLLVACEESQEIAKAFRKIGVEAYSCDVQDCSGGHPEWHIKKDAILEAYSGKYEMMIAHPPCTRLNRRGQYWTKIRGLEKEKEKAINFFIQLYNAPIHRIVIENPIGIMSTIFRKPSQIIHPYYFGDPESKATCLWLKNVPLLEYSKRTNLFYFKTSVPPRFYVTPSGHRMSFSDKQSGKDQQRRRAKTFPGVAKAMAEQWGRFLL